MKPLENMDFLNAPVPASGGRLGLDPLSVGSSVRDFLAAGSDAEALVKKGVEPAPGLGFLAYALAACTCCLSNIRNL